MTMNLEKAPVAASLPDRLGYIGSGTREIDQRNAAERSGGCDRRAVEVEFEQVQNPEWRLAGPSEGRLGIQALFDG